MGSRHRPYDSHAPRWDDSDTWVVAGEEPGEPDPPPQQPGYRQGRPPRDDRRYDPPPYGPAQPGGGAPQPYDAPQPHRDDWYGAPPPPGQPPPARRAPRDRAPPEPVARFDDFDDAEELDPEPDPPPWPAVLSWTLCYFLVPVLLYLGWAVTRSGEVPPGCVDETGAPCMSPRGDAIEAFVNVGPALVGALALAVVASVVMRRLTASWRPGTVGFAASVVGAATATVVTGLLR